MGQFGRLELIQRTQSGGATATCPVLSRHDNGSLIIRDGLSIMDTESGPVALNFRSAWQRPDEKLTVEMLKRAEWIEEENIPVPTPKQGYRLGVTTLGYMVKLQPEDARAMACELSEAHYVGENGERTIVNGVFAITARAFNALGLNKVKVAFETREVKAQDIGFLPEGVAYVRENGGVPYAVDFANGDRLESVGFPKGSQRASVVAAAEAELDANSVLNRVNTGTVIKAAAATGNAAQAQAQSRNRRPAPNVTY